MHSFFTSWPAPRKRRVILAALAMTAALAAEALPGSGADVSVADAWVRTPRDGYRTTVASLTLLSARDVRLLGASSPAAQAVQLQQTARHGAAVQAERVDFIDVQGGRPLVIGIGPDRYQLLVVGLRTGLKEGDRVPLRLLFGDASGRHRFDRRVSAVIRSPAGYLPHEPEDVH